MNKYCVVITTFANPEVGGKITNQLLEMQLAACIQSFAIQSAYVWEGQVNREPETILLIKAKVADYSEIEACIRSNHDYTTPEVIMLPIEAGSSDYLNWISSVTKKQH